jgi:site-specific DNA recombinase
VYAQLDNEIKGERTKDGMIAAVNEGYWVHRAPLGYLNVVVPGGLIQDETRASLVKKCFELFDAGRSKVDVLNVVTDLGLVNRSGTRLVAQSLDNLLRNPLYCGLICIPKWDLVSEGKFIPIVDRELFNRVQDRLNGRQATDPKSDMAEHFPLRVFLQCASCGHGLTGSFSTGRRGGKYPYYFCRTRGCRAVSFKTLDLEVLFLDFLATMKLRPEMKALAFEAIRQEWQKRKAVDDDLLAQARKRVTQLLAWKAKIIKAWIEERISKEIYGAQLQTVGKELEAAGLTEGETFADLAEVELLLDFADRMLSDVSIIWGNAAWADKQRIQRTIFPNGLLVSKEEFGTTEGSSLFIQLQQGTGTNQVWRPQRDSNPRYRRERAMS